MARLISLKVDVLKNDITSYSRAAQRRVQEACLDTARAIEERSAQLMRSTKSGRVYGGHQASAPGEAPAVDTGALIGSSFVEAAEQGALVGWRAPHAPYLEFGTSRMAPRPFARPAADESRGDFEGAIRRAVGE